MWLYLVLVTGAITGFSFYKFQTLRDGLRIGKEVYKVIKRNGPGVCLYWSRQIMTNQCAKYFVEMHHKYYIVHYPYGVTWYKIMIPRRRGPCKVDTITDIEGNDVKQELQSFLGPGDNFHGINITPNMIGYSQLTFAYIDGDIKTFVGDEIINI